MSGTEGITYQGVRLDAIVFDELHVWSKEEDVAFQQNANLISRATVEEEQAPPRLVGSPPWLLPSTELH